jgi:site-specific recombinase XerD
MDGGSGRGSLTVEQAALRAGHDGGRTQWRRTVGVRVERGADGYRLAGDWAGTEAANAFLGHLEARAFAAATIRAYAYDLLNFARFVTERRVALADLVPTDLFDWLDWQRPPRRRTGTILAFGARGGAAPASVNRRVAALRAFFEHQVLTGVRASNPVPAPRRGGAGLRPKARGPLGHLGPGRTRAGGRLVRELRRLPESLDPAEVGAFLADLGTHRDRAIVLAMVLGGLRAGEVRSLRLADVDQGRHRVRVIGKGGRERVVPIDRACFSELAAYLHEERPPALATPECFVVLRGPTAGRPITEAGLRSLFRHHRDRSGAVRVRPHRLRHTYGTELATAGIDLLVLRELMGHASPETTAGYVHLSADHLAAEYQTARAAIGR